jgi:hypothetical protein
MIPLAHSTPSSGHFEQEDEFARLIMPTGHCFGTEVPLGQ